MNFTRSLPLIGEDGLARLAACRVTVVGLGGVGGYAVEVLARSGVGALTLIDGDKVEESNLNRQITARLPRCVRISGGIRRKSSPRGSSR